MSEEMREEMEQNTETGTEDIYQVYMEELAVIPPCTEEENRELLKRVKAGEREAKNRLVEGNLKKALFFIQDYLNRGVESRDGSGGRDAGPGQRAPGGVKAHGRGAGKRGQLKGAGGAHEDDRGGCP